MRRRRAVAGAAATVAALIPLLVARADDQAAPADPLARAPDIRRPDEPFSVPLFGRPLSIGGELATEAGYEGNFSLSREGGDDFGFVLQELALELSYPVTENVSLFVQGLAYYEGLFEPGDHRVEGALELGEAWLLAEDLGGSGVALQLGRQAVWEERNWWWDDTVDAVRVVYDEGPFEAEAALGRDVGRLSVEQGGPTRERGDAFQTFGTAAWRFAGGHWLDGFLVYRDGTISGATADRPLRRRDDDEVDGELLWLGARLSGEFELGGRLGELDHLLEGAWVGGRERDPSRRERTRPVSGWALMAEGAWETEWPGKPSLTVGYAFGSGDREPGDGRSRAFRQTGLGSNDGTFGGVEYFNYYGELLEPELSNLQIWSAALGFEFWRRSSLVLVHHSYLQAYAAPTLRDADLTVDPLGHRRGIGHAWDVVLGLQEWDRIEIDVIGSLFRAGPAYGARAGRLASSVELTVTVNF